MISLFLASALAADPVALRQIHGPGALLDLGSESLGVAVDVGPVLMGATYRYGATLGAEVGSRRPLGQGDTPWGLDVLGAVGLHALLATPGLALVATGELRGGFRGDHTHLTGGLVAPLAIGLQAHPQLAVPLGLEARVSFRAGPLWIGGRAQVGSTLSIGGTPAALAKGGVFVQGSR
jgi:hypothetical protein